jgi:peptidoglycan/LPS O-acetylase OafA/YrhL
MRRTVGGAFDSGCNNFDALRLLAALLVLFSHSYPLTRTGPDPVLLLTAGHTDAGAAAVAAFFVISGFLVTRSVLTREPSDYVRSRLLRILPALAIVTLVQTFLVGAWFTTLPWRAYLTQPGTWAGLGNALVFDIHNTLPGVFEANPYAAVVNGSMWTLPVECAFYLALPLAALLGLLRPGIVVVTAVVALAALFPGAAWLGLSWAEPGPFVVWDVPLYPALSCLSYFLLGAALWVHRRTIPLSGGLAVCCLIALFASARSVSADVVFHVTFPYLVLYAALARPAPPRWMGRIGDLSYGTYLYAFPIQQSVIAWHDRPIGAVHLAVVATPLVLGCAALSWHLVERPALALKARDRRPASPVVS